MRHTTIRILLALVAQFDLELEQLDIKTAFLYGDLEERILMEQPELFEKGSTNQVCLLKKSLYGLKQSPRQWYRKFDWFMVNAGFIRSSFDGCFYFKCLYGECYIYLALYVDDMLVACKDLSEIARFKEEMSRQFEMKDLGQAKKILGMNIERDKKNEKLILSQKEYAGKVIRKFNMTNSKPVKTPLGQHFKLSSVQCPETEEERKEMNCIPYANAIGSLMYLMVCTRPDLAFAVSSVSKFMSNPGKNHWEAVKWVLRYVRGTMTTGIVYSREQNQGNIIVGYVDADYAGNIDNRKSMTGFCFSFWNNLVSWKANLQAIVTLSTTEAEYVAITEAVKEAMWLKGMLEEMGLNQQQVPIKSDSQSAIFLCKNQVFHERSKHIDVRLHFIRNLIEDKAIKVEKVPGCENPADMFTKSVVLDKLRLFKSLLHIEEK